MVCVSVVLLRGEVFMCTFSHVVRTIFFPMPFQGRLRDYSKDLNKSQLGELWAKNNRGGGKGGSSNSGPEFSPKSVTSKPGANANGFPGAAASSSPGDFLRPGSAPSNRNLPSGANLHGSWLNGTNPRTVLKTTRRARLMSLLSVCLFLLH
jgi:hypothetical protein